MSISSNGISLCSVASAVRIQQSAARCTYDMRRSSSLKRPVQPLLLPYPQGGGDGNASLVTHSPLALVHHKTLLRFDPRVALLEL